MKGNFLKILLPYKEESISVSHISLANGGHVAKERVGRGIIMISMTIH